MSLSPEIRSIIREIRENIAAIGRRFQEYVDAKAAADRRQVEKDKANRDSKQCVEVSYAAAIREQHSAENDKNRRVQWVTAIGTWSAVVAASVYAGIAAYQLGQMRKATRAAEAAALAARDSARTESETLRNSIQSFRLDERAWIEIGKIETIAYPPDPPKFGATFKFGFYPKNVGKTVATDVTVHLDNVFGSGMLLTDEKGIRMFEDQLFKQQGSPKRSLSPDKPAPQTLAPGELSVAPVYIGGQEPSHMGHGSYWYGYIIGRIDYVDVFGTHHWKHLCLTVIDARGDLTYCQYGNDEDKTPEKPD
jgi:hypothetical protein